MRYALHTHDARGLRPAATGGRESAARVASIAPAIKLLSRPMHCARKGEVLAIRETTSSTHQETPP